MARNILFLVLILCVTICYAAIVQPISIEHRSAALELFTRSTDGSFGSLQETYEALRTFQILGIEKNVDISPATCPLVVKIFESPSSNSTDLFNALRVNHILKCNVDADLFEGVASTLQAVIKDASSLLDFYHSIGSLVLIKDEVPESNIILGDSDATFHSIKALSQSDGRWRYSYNGAESSTYAAGLALEALAGVISLASSELDESMVSKYVHTGSKIAVMTGRCITVSTVVTLNSTEKAKSTRLAYGERTREFSFYEVYDKTEQHDKTEQQIKLEWTMGSKIQIFKHHEMNAPYPPHGYYE